jgi:precorrin-2 dehydrogenase/sirohydrochlorin ferrochelatase
MPESLNPVPGVYYPVFLNLKDRKVVVVGGGKVAERKVFALLRAGADLRVISREITRKIERERKKGGIKHIRRQYRKGDLRGKFLAIAATDSSAINERISRDAPCLVNVVDTPRLCNFIVPSVMKRGAMTIAISTGGISPALSRVVRKELEKLYGSEFSGYLETLGTIRAEALKDIGNKRKRAEFLKSLASGEMLGILRGKGCGEAKRRAAASLKKAKRKGD